MKKPLALVLSAGLLFSAAHAELDLASMSDSDLYALRVSVNEEISSRIERPSINGDMILKEIFPDPILARFIRDKLALFSTSDAVTQADLDQIKEVHFRSYDDGLTSLEGVQYLTNLEELYLYFQSGMKELPEGVGNLEYLKVLCLDRCGISSLPDSICNLTRLESLSIADTDVSELPADIGNLTSLKKLDISDTKITSLPESIYQLTLDKFERKGLPLD